jgi:hypothetical protein
MIPHHSPTLCFPCLQPIFPLSTDATWCMYLTLHNSQRVKRLLISLPDITLCGCAFGQLSDLPRGLITRVRFRCFSSCTFLGSTTQLHIKQQLLSSNGGFKAKFNEKKNLHGSSPRANYTDRATAACRRSDCQPFLRIEDATWSA